jgi:ribonucleoside-diphosphate reductase alpha chain
MSRVIAATMLGTVQATYTDFHYLREVWKRNTEKDALIGIGMTGIASNKVEDSWYSKAAMLVKTTNATYAKMLGINKAARTTCVKPAGTTSCVLGTSSGIHAWYGKHYIRSVRVGKSEAIYPYLLEKLPDLIEDEIGKEDESAVLSIPQTIPYDNVTTRADETALEMLERVKFVSENWVKTGHRRGNNGHNVSATVYVKPTEWKEVTQWLWDNRHSYNGMSFLPYNGGEYKQAPFEEIDEERYNEMVKQLHPIDLTEVIELEDTTNLQGEIACAGGACEV